MQLAPSAGGSTLKLRMSPSGTIEAVEGEACQLLNANVASCLLLVTARLRRLSAVAL